MSFNKERINALTPFLITAIFVTLLGGGWWWSLRASISRGLLSSDSSVQQKNVVKFQKLDRFSQLSVVDRLSKMTDDELNLSKLQQIRLLRELGAGTDLQVSLKVSQWLEKIALDRDPLIRTESAKAIGDIASLRVRRNPAEKTN